MGLSAERYVADGWGVGELWFRDGLLVHHELPRAAAEPGTVPPRGEHEPPSGTIAALDGSNGDGFGSEVARDLRAFFAGQQPSFDRVRLELGWCTPFQRAIVRALRGVRYGEVVTYGELAAVAGYPNAHRAAGSFCARNRFPILVPCHRVVAAAGIGSYGSLGVGYKRRLLRLEGVTL